LTKHEQLWQQLLEHLDREGLLAIHLVALTPAEIARQVAASTGDPRVHRFVWAYYYPRSYGNEKGSMSDKQARALVASFDKPRPADSKPIADSGVPPLVIPKVVQPNCVVCGTRRPAG